MTGVLVTPLARSIPVFRDAVYIGIDAGAEKIVRAGLDLALALGDFDSGDLPLDCDLFVHPVEKDKSDLEIGLEKAREMELSPIVVAGALGGRIDHTIANIRLLEYKFPDAVFWEPRQQVCVLEEGVHTIGQGWKNVSFFSTGESRIWLQGFRYPLEDYRLVRQDVLCLSNQVTGRRGRVQVAGDRILCVMTNE